jgi:hypothetical protein
MCQRAPRPSLRDRFAALVVELRSTPIHVRLIAICLSLLRLIDLSSFPSERFKRFPKAPRDPSDREGRFALRGAS